MAGAIAAIPFVAGYSPRLFAPKQRTKLTLVMVPGVVPPGIELNLEEMVRRFTRANPDIDLGFRKLDWEDVLEQGQPAIQMAVGPKTESDVLLLPWYKLQALWREGMLTELTELASLGKGLGLDTLYPRPLGLMYEEGKLWGIPAVADPWVTVVNAESLEAAGLELPPSDWDWSEFREFLINIDERISSGFAFGSVGDDYLPFVYQNGTRLADSLFFGVREYYLDTSEVQETIKWYADLALKDQVMPTPSQALNYELESEGEYVFQTTTTGAVDRERVRKWNAVMQGRSMVEMAKMDGNVAVWFEPLSQPRLGFDTDKTRLKYEYVVLPLPRQRERATLLELAAFAITAHTKHPEGCWRAIDFLTQQVPSLGLPVRHDVAESKEYLAILDESVRPCIADCLALLDEAILIPSTFKTLTDQWLLPAMYAILEKDIPVNEALKEAQEMAEVS